MNLGAFWSYKAYTKPGHAKSTGRHEGDTVYSPPVWGHSQTGGKLKRELDTGKRSAKRDFITRACYGKGYILSSGQAVCEVTRLSVVRVFLLGSVSTRATGNHNREGGLSNKL